MAGQTQDSNSPRAAGGACTHGTANLRLAPPFVHPDNASHPLGRPAIRIGLKQVKGIAKADLESVLAARAEGPFTSLADFCRRTTVPRDVIENLILCGAFDSIDRSRRQLLWELDAALRRRAPAPVEDGQPALLAGGMGVSECGSVGARTRYQSGEEIAALQKSGPNTQHPTPSAQHPAPLFPDPTAFELAQWEVETLGFTVGAHPVTLFAEHLSAYGATPASELPGCADGQRVRVAGVVLCRMRPPTKTGVVVVFITLEDETGVVDTVIFPRVYDEYGKAAFASDLLVIEGRVQKLGKRSITLLAGKVFNPLEGLIEDRIDGRTGLARRELPLPATGIAPAPMQRDYNPAERDSFHEQFPDPLADEETLYAG
jgi:DNA polymerase III alpha subunit